MKHFSLEEKHYLIASSQVRSQIPLSRCDIVENNMSTLTFCYFVLFLLQIFVWTRGSFTLLQTLDFEGDILSVSPFTRQAVPHLLVCVDGQNVSCGLLRWTNRRFQNLQPLKLKGRAIKAEIINTRADETLLLVVLEGSMLFLIIASI